MFSGIVETVGLVEAVQSRKGGMRLSIDASGLAQELNEGSSVSVSGVCLTVSAKEARNVVAVDVIPETMSRTTLGSLVAGERVNLELPLRLSDRLGGHLVSGHVDGVGIVRAIESEGEGKRMTIEPPVNLMRYVVYKGSVAVAGVSLTVAAVKCNGFEVALIPYTIEKTTLGSLTCGGHVNVEMDMVAKYAERLLAGRCGRDAAAD